MLSDLARTHSLQGNRDDEQVDAFNSQEFRSKYGEISDDEREDTPEVASSNKESTKLKQLLNPEKVQYQGVQILS